MRNRNRGILIYLSDKEKNYLNKQSSAVGISNSAYIRKLIMGDEIRPRPPDEYYKILKEINAVGVNINQIARIANSEHHISSAGINEAVKMVGQIMDIVRGF